MKNGKNPYEYTGTPDPKSGIKFLSVQDIAELMKKPHMRKANDEIERGVFNGRSSAAKVLLFNQAKKNYYQDSLAKFNAGAIKIAKMKAEGKY